MPTADQQLSLLVVAPAWVGDMVMSQVIYTRLKAADPDCQIDLLAPAATLPLASRMTEIRQALLIDQQHGQLGLGYRYRLGRELRGKGYARALVTPNSFKSALVPFFADIPQRTGFLGEYRYYLLNDLRLLDKKRLPKMVDRFLALTVKPDATVPAPSQPHLSIDVSNQRRLVEKFQLDLAEPVVGLCPGAEYGDAKQWPVEHFAELAKRLMASGKAVWVFGSAGDADIAAQLTGLTSDGCVNLAGKTSLTDAVDLLALCEAVVSNDSGLMHVAAAVGARVVALYGSTSPDFTPPGSSDAVLLSTGIECSPCFKRTCPLGHRNCLRELHPNLAFDALEAG
ncbi:MAG: lipopolysaccharide heptosyltransferase II [Pseudomonadales bacterium]